MKKGFCFHAIGAIGSKATARMQSRTYLSLMDGEKQKKEYKHMKQRFFLSLFFVASIVLDCRLWWQWKYHDEQ